MKRVASTAERDIVVVGVCGGGDGGGGEWVVGGCVDGGLAMTRLKFWRGKYFIVIVAEPTE